MMNNRINIEFLRGQMDKVLEDIEELKDKNREMHYQNGGKDRNCIRTYMFKRKYIKEHRIQTRGYPIA